MKYLGAWLINSFSVRSLVVLMLLGGSCYLAVVDESYRPQFADLAKIGLGGYLGQLLPRGKG
ncbi:MAG: hypothetical protein ACRC2R_10870 [Xenococcaceae cyanobacterium]